ncbi:hypothetical protein KI387_030474, partial [Taxus chinensis]
NISQPPDGLACSMMALPYIEAISTATYYITRVFAPLNRHIFFLSSLAVFVSAYFYISIHSKLSAGGEMADTQVDSHQELPFQPPSPPSSSSPSAREKMGNTQEEKTDTTQEEENIGNTQKEKEEEKMGTTQEEKEKVGINQEDSTEDLPRHSSPLPPPPSPFASASPAAPQRYEAQESARFKLTETCLLILHRGDITEWFVDGQSDAIVNAANRRLLGGGGVDGAIHSAAGRDLLTACKNIPEVHPGVRCPVGSARITRGFQLSASYIIHAVGPIYHLEEYPESKLSDAYRSSLEVARENDVKYIAFPAISCGVYGYPYEEAAEVSLTTVRDNATNLKEVHFVLFEEPAWDAW